MEYKLPVRGVLRVNDSDPYMIKDREGRTVCSVVDPDAFSLIVTAINNEATHARMSESYQQSRSAYLGQVRRLTQEVTEWQGRASILKHENNKLRRKWLKTQQINKGEEL